MNVNRSKQNGLGESDMTNDKKTQKVRVKNAVVKFQRDAPPETPSSGISVGF